MKHKKETMELRYYDIPQDTYVLALLGESWIREYGLGISNLHFHNLMEIGFCRNGTGELVLEESVLPYHRGMFSIIPANYPHITNSTPGSTSFWEYLFLEPKRVIVDLYPNDLAYQKKLLGILNRKAVFTDRIKSPVIASVIQSIMEEMRRKEAYYEKIVNELTKALILQIIRMNEEDRPVENGRCSSGMLQIMHALDYISMEYARPIKIIDLAKLCNLSETHFRRVFESSMKMSPVDYINLIRVQMAIEVLKRSQDPMDLVAQQVGFANTSTFNRNFQKFLNTTPYQWKKNEHSYERKLLKFNISALKGW